MPFSKYFIFYLCAGCLLSYASAANENENIELEFFEFLGAFEDSSGKWQDPMEIDEILTATANNEEEPSQSGSEVPTHE